MNNNIINDNETEINVTLRLHPSIFRVLQIFSNLYSRKDNEVERIDEFLSQELTSLLQSLAEDQTGIQKDLSDTLKELIQRCLEGSKNDNLK